MSNRVIITDSNERASYNYLMKRLAHLNRIMCKMGGTFALKHNSHIDVALDRLIDDITDCEHRAFKLKSVSLRIEVIHEIVHLRECLYNLAEDTWRTIVLI